ncbi:hypothetical protein F4780DRAFT_44086 [Xylariomycetidae sp. FL0641]|nr:hypothetical protein F4780DRAFT_44086 [Xylariomycetidae sp. FL0641]
MAEHSPPPPISTPETLPGYTSNANAAPPRSVKRPRPVKSCLECRRRKLKCDRLLPCSQCQRSQRHCRYAADGELGSVSDGSDAEAPERASKRACPPGEQDSAYQTPVYQAGSQASRGFGTSVLEDHAARIERLEKAVLGKAPSTTSHSEGRSQRPVASALTIRGLTVKGGLRTRFFGQSSTRVLVNLFDEAKEFMFSQNESSGIREKFMNLHKVHQTLQEEHRRVTTPIAVFVDSMTPIHKRMADILPEKPVCDLLVRVYLKGSESIYRIVHIPTFMNQYENYWEGKQLPEAFLPQLLSILCLGYRFIGAGKGKFQNDREGIHIPTACSLVRLWLDSLRGKQLVEFSTLQTEVIHILAQRMIKSQNQETWTGLGLIVRMAMTMGLHRDPGEFPQKISPFWAEQRRKLWHTILELDVHVSMQCNLPSCIREGDWTCQPPRNLNDVDIEPNTLELPPSKPIEEDTDSRIQVFASSSLATRFKIVDIVNRVDSLQDYQQVLELGNELERVFEDIKYVVPQVYSLDREEYRRRWMTRVVLDMNCRRPLLALYRPFALSSTDAPQQIMTGYLRSSMVLLSYMDDLDPNTPEYHRIWHMHHLILKQDILQAAFGVCYYIKHTNMRNTSPRSPSWHTHTRSASVEEACAAASESSFFLSGPRLVAVVEKVINNMIKRISELGMSMKDIISLVVVFYTYQIGTVEEKKEAISQGMQKILDAGLQAIRTNQEKITSLPIMSLPVSSPVSLETYPPNTSFGGPMQPFMMTPDLPNILPDDLGMWDMEFWNPFQPGSTG